MSKSWDHSIRWFSFCTPRGILNDVRALHVDVYLHQQGLDTSTPTGKATFQMVGVFAELERAIICERVIVPALHTRVHKYKKSPAGEVAGLSSGINQKSSQARALSTFEQRSGFECGWMLAEPGRSSYGNGRKEGHPIPRLCRRASSARHALPWQQVSQCSFRDR